MRATAALEFDPATHTYSVGGERWPSVTQVLQLLEDFSAVPPAVLEAARVFGSHVHEAVAFEIRGQLDWESLDPALVPYVEAWRRFAAESGVSILASEQRVAHRRQRYAGTLDVLGILRGCLTLIDVKSGQLPRTVGPQTAAYAEALGEMGRTRPKRRLCVQLNPDFPNGYRIHSLTNPADWTLFQSALNCWRFRNAV